MARFEVVIIGGAVIGNSIAYWLSLDPALRGRILVIERDPTYKHASTALSAASIRLQFSDPLNVEISKFGVQFLRELPALMRPVQGAFDIAFRENGYLFLASSDSHAAHLRAIHALQIGRGASTVLLDPPELSVKFPYLNTDDIALGSYGATNEGWFDNIALMHSLKIMALHNGVKYLHGEVTSMDHHDGHVLDVLLSDDSKISANKFINAAGPRAAKIAAMAAVKIPVERRKRTTFVFQTCEPPPANAPLMVDPSGGYVRPEGQLWMGAVTPAVDPAVDCNDFEPRYPEFEDVLWPMLAHRAKFFEAIKLRGAWAGHYAYNTFDQNAIVGLHPDVDNLYFANGFSGHGLQQAPAIGRGIAEIIRHGAFQTLDLSPFGFARILAGRRAVERMIV